MRTDEGEEGLGGGDAVGLGEEFAAVGAFGLAGALLRGGETLDEAAGVRLVADSEDLQVGVVR